MAPLPDYYYIDEYPELHLDDRIGWKVTEQIPTLEQIQGCYMVCFFRQDSNGEEHMLKFSSPSVVYDETLGGNCICFENITEYTNTAPSFFSEPHLFVGTEGEVYNTGVYVFFSNLEENANSSTECHSIKVVYATIHFPEA